MKHTLATLIFLFSTIILADSQFLVGGSFGQFKNNSTIDSNDLQNAYEAKIGFKEEQGIFALAYTYAEEQESKDPDIKERYSSLLVLLEGLTEPQKFIGSMKAQLLLGVHGGLLFGSVNGEEKENFIYGLQGGAYFPMGKMFAVEMIYRYSLTDMKYDIVQIKNIQQLNLGVSFTF